MRVVLSWAGAGGKKYAHLIICPYFWNLSLFMLQHAHVTSMSLENNQSPKL